MQLKAMKPTTITSKMFFHEVQPVWSWKLSRFSEELRCRPLGHEGVAFGKFYESSLARFARSEGQKGGEILQTHQHRQAIVVIIERVMPYLRPGVRSGGISSSRQRSKSTTREVTDLAIYGAGEGR